MRFRAAVYLVAEGGVGSKLAVQAEIVPTSKWQKRKRENAFQLALTCSCSICPMTVHARVHACAFIETKKEKRKKSNFCFPFFVCKASDTRQTHVYSFLHAVESESTSFICRVILYIITSASCFIHSSASFLLCCE